MSDMVIKVILGQSFGIKYMITRHQLIANMCHSYQTLPHMLSYMLEQIPINPRTLTNPSYILGKCQQILLLVKFGVASACHHPVHSQVSCVHSQPAR
jgi:hypothetical protein